MQRHDSLRASRAHSARLLLILGGTHSASWAGKEKSEMKRAAISASLLLAFAVWAPRAWGDPYPADNTGKNMRDRSGDTLTSGDQSENARDLTITQNVRQALVADDSLSTNAHNVKVITVDGVVTLRGPVSSAQEKAKVSAAAERIAGVKRVDNQLEITNQ